MKTIKITGHLRKEHGKVPAQKLREEAMVPCVLYGGGPHLHFAVDMAELQPLIYTDQVYFVALDIAGQQHTAILQEAQFHPVSELILHLDFLRIVADKKIRMQIPITFQGDSPGVMQGGLLVKKLPRLALEALPGEMPSQVAVDIRQLELGKTIKVQDLSLPKGSVLNHRNAPVVTVIVPRALRSKEAAENKG